MQYKTHGTCSTRIYFDIEDGKVHNVRFDNGCNDWTATGAYATYGVIAVDPSIIPLGSKVYIVSDDGKFVYGFASAEDTGGAIKGNKIDLCYDSVAECFIFGRRQCTVYILSYGD